MSGSSIELSKLVSYVALDQIDARLTKLVSYVVLDQVDARLSKLVAYAVLNPGNADYVITSDHYTGVNASSRTLSDTVTSSDTFTPVFHFTATLSDTVTTSDTLTPTFSQGIFAATPVFPSLPVGFPVKVSIVMDTTVGTTKSLREMRVMQQTNPIWDIEIPFEELVDETPNQSPYLPFNGLIQYQELTVTWLLMYGQTGNFLFDCPWDDSRQDQIIGVGDGATYIFTVSRTWGFGSTATIAPVGAVNVVTNVKVNGSVVSSAHYYVVGNILYFQDSAGVTYPPGAGLDITMTFTYYYLCRFVEDEQDFEEFSKNRWTVPSLKFRAVVWPQG
jgi:hypothetical protein